MLRLTGSVAGLDVAELLKGSGSPGGITGRLGGTVSLVASGAGGAALMRTARGTIKGAVMNGTMPRLDLVRSVVLAFGKPSGAPPEGSGTAFTRLGGTFALASAALKTENLALESRDFDTAGRATFSLETGAVEARADLVLSRELTAQAGSNLRRYAQQDGRVIVPATVAGTERTCLHADPMVRTVGRLQLNRPGGVRRHARQAARVDRRRRRGPPRARQRAAAPRGGLLRRPVQEEERRRRLTLLTLIQADQPSGRSPSRAQSSRRRRGPRRGAR